VQDLESYKNKRILLPTCTYTGTRTPLWIAPASDRILFMSQFGIYQ
jgi:hypothetical protein